MNEKVLSLEPDEHMKWIYDVGHEDYGTPRAVNLRRRRASAIDMCPEWMVNQARMHDELKKARVCT